MYADVVEISGDLCTDTKAFADLCPVSGMRRTALCVFAVIVLTSAAGCAALVPEFGSEGQRETLAAPSVTVTDTTAEGIPGLNEDGTIDHIELANAHASTLEGRSFGVRHIVTVSAQNGTPLRQERWSGSIGANGTQFALVRGVWRTGHTWTFDRYWSANASSPVLRSHSDENSTEYVSYTNPESGVLRATDIVGTDPSFRNRLAQLLSIVKTASVRNTDGSIQSVSVSEFKHPEGVGLFQNGSISDLRMTFLLEERGHVERLSLEYTVMTGNQTLHVEERFWFRVATGIEIEPPEWVESARGSVDREVSGDRSRDSVGKPRVSGGGTHWDNSTDTGNLSDPYPDRAVGGAASPAAPQRGQDPAGVTGFHAAKSVTTSKRR